MLFDLKGESFLVATDSLEAIVVADDSGRSNRALCARGNGLVRNGDEDDDDDMKWEMMSLLDCF